MKVLIDIPDDQLEAVDRAARTQQCSREAIILVAIEEFAAEQRRRDIRNAFGIWDDLEVDGLEYQRALRKEWDD